MTKPLPNPFFVFTITVASMQSTLLVTREIGAFISKLSGLLFPATAIFAFSLAGSDGCFTAIACSPGIRKKNTIRGLKNLTIPCEFGRHC